MACFNSGVAHARMVPSGSMAPTFVPGDRLLIFAWRAPASFRRGDILVFKPPFRGLPGAADASGLLAFADDSTYVKRVVGLPGESIQIKRGEGVFVDGRRLAEPYTAGAPEYAWGPQTVPAGRLFMLGDNRNDSFDSHYWGFLSAEHVVGRPTAVIWPPRRWARF
jgi:signal peptidase I